MLLRFSLSDFCRIQSALTILFSSQYLDSTTAKIREHLLLLIALRPRNDYPWLSIVSSAFRSNVSVRALKILLWAVRNELLIFRRIVSDAFSTQPQSSFSDWHEKMAVVVESMLLLSSSDREAVLEELARCGRLGSEIDALKLLLVANALIARDLPPSNISFVSELSFSIVRGFYDGGVSQRFTDSQEQLVDAFSNFLGVCGRDCLKTLGPTMLYELLECLVSKQSLSAAGRTLSTVLSSLVMAS